MPKPKFGQTIVVTTGPTFGPQPVEFTTGFIEPVRTTGPPFGARRIIDTGAFGSSRIVDTTP